MKRFFKFALFAVLPLLAFSCSDDEPNGGPNQDPDSEDYNDVVFNRLAQVLTLDEQNSAKIEINTSEPVEVTMPERSALSVTTVIEDGKQYAKVESTEYFTGNYAIENVLVAPKNDPKHGRHMFVVAIKEGGGTNKIAASRSNPSSPLLSCYSEVMGKGTFCFGELGNTQSSVLLYDRIVELGERYVTVNSTINQESMVELNEATSESAMHQFAISAGVDFKKTIRTSPGPAESITIDGVVHEIQPEKPVAGSLTGSFSFGVTTTDKESQDFEYYMNLLNVRKSEVAIQMPLFELSANNQHPDVTLFTMVHPNFIDQIIHSSPDSFDPDLFFDTWGTDVITNGVFGGRCLYLYARSENVYEHSLGIDASASLKYNKKVNEGESWLDIYKARNSPYVSGNVDASYHSEEYQSASKEFSYFKVVGGNLNDNNAAKWLEAFNSSTTSENWSLISYRRLPSEALNPDADNDEEFNWELYPVEKLANDMLLMYYSVNAGQMTHDDSIAANRSEKVIEKLCDAKIPYLEAHAFKAAERSRIVVADFMMKNGENGHKKGDPKSFIALDPRDNSKKKYLIYYPMMANKYSPVDKGYAIETSQDKFYPGLLDDEDQYWYYALAHENDCDGIVDFKLVKDSEAGDYYHPRGDNADVGGSGGLLNNNRVQVKYFDPAINDPSEKITAVGLYLKKDDNKTVKTDRIFASSGGSELAPNATESEFNAWDEWWKTGSRVVDYQWNEKGLINQVRIWGVCSTKTLPISRFKDKGICHPKPW